MGLGRKSLSTQTLVDHLAQQVVLRPSQIFDLGDKLGPDPMYAAEDEQRAEPARARRRNVERHGRRRPRLQAAPQAFKLRMVDASAGAAGVNQPTIRIIV